MPDEPDKLVLVQLRAIRATLDEVNARLAEAERQHQEVRGWVVDCLGPCSINHLKNEEQDARLTEQERRSRSIQEIQEVLRTRIGRLEERPE